MELGSDQDSGKRKRAKPARKPVQPRPLPGPRIHLDLPPNLSPREAEFVAARLAGQNQTDAYRRISPDAKSPQVGGCLMAQRPSVRAALAMGAKAAQQAQARAIVELAEFKARTEVVNKAYVMDRLRTVVERSLQHEPVLDKQGNPTGEYRYDSAGANGALKMLGQELGMFVHRAEIRHTAHQSDADYDRAIAMAAKELAEIEGKSVAEVLRDAARSHQAIDVSPTELAAIADAVDPAAQVATDDPPPPGGEVETRATGLLLVHPPSRSDPTSGLPKGEAHDESEGIPAGAEGVD